MISLLFSLFFAFSLHAQAQQWRTVYVLKGEDAQDIAWLTGCKVETFLKINGLKHPDLLRQDMALKLPLHCIRHYTIPRFAIQRMDENLSAFAKRIQCPPSRLKALNKINHRRKDDFQWKLPPSCRKTKIPWIQESMQAVQNHLQHFDDFVNWDCNAHQKGWKEVQQLYGVPHKVLQKVNGLSEPLRKCLIIPPFHPQLKLYRAEIDHSILATLMQWRGFVPPRGFRAYVIEVSWLHPTTIHRFDYNGLSLDLKTWNPGSTVKLLAAIALLKALQVWKIPLKTHVRIYSRHPRTFYLPDLFKKTLVDSDNIAYNRLVQITGHDFLNHVFLPKYGLNHSQIVKPFAPSQWLALGEKNRFRTRPRLYFWNDAGEIEIPWRGKRLSNTWCMGSACTTLRDLGEAMMNLGLQKVLGLDQGFAIDPKAFEQLLGYLSDPHRHGQQAIRVFQRAAGREKMFFYNKSGYTRGWFSDNMLIIAPERRIFWVVTMSSSSGPWSLVHPSEVLARILFSGELSAIQEHSP